jgi:D-sedoheptulose 7-phosphate isomerase
MFKKSLMELRSVLGLIDTDKFYTDLNKTVQLVSSVFLEEKKMLLAGNGGSAAEAQHMAGEYTATLSSKNFRRGYPAIALTTDTSFLTAWTNDFGFIEVFSRQVETLGVKGDVFFAYSTSGDSENIISAANLAKSKGINVIGFTGNGGGKLKACADICFDVPSNSTARIQEVHTFLGHTICAEVERAMGHLG